jgi:hypothetical protein
MLRAVRRQMVLNADWLEAEELGRTGAPEAIPLLEEIFSRRGKGWAVMAAGLSLARCGSEIGERYVTERLRDPGCCRGAVGTPQDGIKDDPFSSKATSFILDHLGLPRDEVFVPDLVRLISSPDYSSTAKAKAWIALSRTNSPRYRTEVLERAWSSPGSDGAARLVVMNDEQRVRDYLSRESSEKLPGEGALQRALAATRRERRRWSEVHGYAF